MSTPRCPNPRCQADYPHGTVQCTNPFCQCLLPGAMVAGRYRIETLIGMGGMGAVYRASDTFDVEQVALKVLSFAMSVMDMDTAVERFRREARYAHQLKHKNIVPVLNFGQDGKLLYLVMPLITGGTLKALLKGQYPLLTSQAQRYVNDLADALDAIHHHPQQIIHRDIKPSNLLIHQDDGRLVITDFGIARAMQQEKGLTQRGWALGTEHYIAPEQEHGKAEPASDIYAMGVIAYQMFTGLLPFQAVIRNHSAELPTPSTLNSTLPPTVDPVILQAINIDPAKRFCTGREFADALNAALAKQNDTDNNIWIAPTISAGAEPAISAGAGPAISVGAGPAISVGAGLAPAQGQTPAVPIGTNVIIRTIIPDNPCGECGRENRHTSHFCRHCGHSLHETSPLVTDVCQVGYLSDIKQQARNNEDMLLIVQGLCNTLHPPPRPFSLFAVADGRGHAEVGYSPARLAIETITDVLLPLLSTSTVTQSLTGTPTEVETGDVTIGSTSIPATTAPTLTSYAYTRRPRPTKQTDEECIEQWMCNAARQANQVIYHCNADYDTTMATTLASIVLYKRHLYLANVGDSRVYCYNEKTGLKQLRTIGIGQGQASLLQATIQDPATINHLLGQQYQIAIELSKREVEVDDLILLCTNGLWHMLDDEHIQKILALGGDTQMLAYTLVEAANTAGGRGNISAIVVRVQ